MLDVESLINDPLQRTTHGPLIVRPATMDDVDAAAKGTFAAWADNMNKFNNPQNDPKVTAKINMETWQSAIIGAINNPVGCLFVVEIEPAKLQDLNSRETRKELVKKQIKDPWVKEHLFDEVAFNLLSSKERREFIFSRLENQLAPRTMDILTGLPDALLVNIFKTSFMNDPFPRIVATANVSPFMDTAAGCLNREGKPIYVLPKNERGKALMDILQGIGLAFSFVELDMAYSAQGLIKEVLGVEGLGWHLVARRLAWTIKQEYCGALTIVSSKNTAAVRAIYDQIATHCGCYGNMQAKRYAGKGANDNIFSGEKDVFAVTDIGQALGTAVGKTNEHLNKMLKPQMSQNGSEGCLPVGASGIGTHTLVAAAKSGCFR